MQWMWISISLTILTAFQYVQQTQAKLTEFDPTSTATATIAKFSEADKDLLSNTLYSNYYNNNNTINENEMVDIEQEHNISAYKAELIKAQGIINKVEKEIIADTYTNSKNNSGNTFHVNMENKVELQQQIQLPKQTDLLKQKPNEKEEENEVQKSTVKPKLNQVLKDNKNYITSKRKSNKTVVKRFEALEHLANTTTTTTSTKLDAALVQDSIPPALPSAKSNSNRPNTFFVNPFGQLVALLGNDQLLNLQDYNFLFNAERHTVFLLHTSSDTTPDAMSTNEVMRRRRQSMEATAVTSKTISTTTTTSSSSSPSIASMTPITETKGLSGSRVLNVVSNSIGAALGVNSISSVGAITATNNNAAGDGATTAATGMIIEEVQLYNAASLRQSRFNPFNPTRILIHGWFGGQHANIYNTLVPTYLKLGNGSYNIFTVDWGRGAVADYLTASYRVKPVGKVVAKFIDFLHQEAGMRFEDLHVIGFSMGAHIAGIAGKHIQTGRLPVIYALDPALPFFRYESFDERISITDADYVEVVHTSAGIYGYDQPLGHVDYYVNYGGGQPGCFFNECNHFRAFQIFAESLTTKVTGQGCDVKLWKDMTKNKRCLMGTGLSMQMGGDPQNTTTLKGKGGVYYLTTNAYPPYTRG